MILDCTWWVEGGTSCYLVVLGQYRVVLVGIGGIGLVEGGTRSV